MCRDICTDRCLRERRGARPNADGHSESRRVANPVFVEVKKPNERISPDQRAEMSFMLSLGLQARVLVLIEA